MARTGLQAALRESAKGRVSAPTPSSPATTAADEGHARQPSRVGKTNVTGYFPPEVKASLRLVQARRGGTIQGILAEALNDLFAKYGVPETAPLDEERPA
jgi:hypothetical protein